jgi:hypothetical protein
MTEGGNHDTARVGTGPALLPVIPFGQVDQVYIQMYFFVFTSAAQMTTLLGTMTLPLRAALARYARCSFDMLRTGPSSLREPQAGQSSGQALRALCTSARRKMSRFASPLGTIGDIPGTLGDRRNGTMLLRAPHAALKTPWVHPLRYKMSPRRGVVWGRAGTSLRLRSGQAACGEQRRTNLW